MKALTASLVWLVSSLIVMDAAAQSGDADRGERLFTQQCKICHKIAKDGGNGVGPNLNGLFGRKAGTASGFSSSAAMTKSGIVWDDKTLADYLKDPKGRVPGTKMVYVGMKRQDQIDDMLAYLHKATP